MTTCPVLSPAVIFILGAFIVPLLRGRFKTAFLLILPVAALFILVRLPEGRHWVLTVLDTPLVLGRVDRLSRIFGIIFILITFIAMMFSLRVRDDLQHGAALVYAGGALGVTLAGDLFSLYVFWELMAVASTFLILARRTRAAQAAAFRYILVHIFGGLCLLAGIILQYKASGTLVFSYMGLETPATALIFIGVALNAALPPLHPWLQDAYPEATVTGAVFLSAFTTKSAVYVMARMFPGCELLVWMGALMTVLPIFYAEIENDIRRVLSYSLMNQVGFMLCGVGLGTPLAINGAVSHAFCHILYKALLFMSAGSVLHMTGKIKCTDIGGLYKTMPLTCLCCLVGAVSISAFPLFSGFVSKSMIISASGHEHRIFIWLMLQFASAGVIAHAGIKVPYFTFFGHDAGIRTQDPPGNMLAAMGIAAFLCVLIGVYPDPLYRMLPYPNLAYLPYTAGHVVGQLQLLLFGTLAFCLLLRSGYYPAEVRGINLDADWCYRLGTRWLYRCLDWGLNGLNRVCNRYFAQGASTAASRLSKQLPVSAAAWVISFFRGSPSRTEYLMEKERVRLTFETGTVPIGIGAAVAALFIALMFVLSII